MPHVDSSALPDAAIPALPPRYRIERELGRGGTAVVYLAVDTRHGRRVAIKVLRPERAAGVDADRFLREIDIASQLSHPHIVPLIDSGRSEGVLYFVVPYIPGGSLRERIAAEGRLSVQESLRIAEEVGSGLDYVHRSGYVHRDVKPGNILFADGHAVLADFGVVQICDAPGVNVLTDSGLAIGTPAYMSPEQASGERMVEARSDIYSLACVLYEMLGGRPPFEADTVRALLAKHVTRQPQSVRALRPEVRSTVDQALTKALAKDPAQRFATVPEFLAALGASAPDVRRLTGKTKSVAVLPFVNAGPDPDNEYLSDGITDELIDALAKVNGLRLASRTSVFALKGKAQDVRAIGVLLGASVVLEGTVRRSGDQLRITAQLTSTDDGTLLWSQRYDRRLSDVFAVEDEIARTIVNTLRATWFGDLVEPLAHRYTDNVKAYAHYLRGRHAWNKRTQEGVLEGVAHFERAIAEDPRYALAYTGLADSYALQVDYRSVPVRDGFERAKMYARQAIALDDSLAEAHASLAWSLFIYDWDWVAADREFRRAIDLNPRYATAHQWYAFLLESQGRIDDALVEAHTASELDSGIGIGAAEPGTRLLLRAPLRSGHLSYRAGDRARSHGGREPPAPGTISGGSGAVGGGRARVARWAGDTGCRDLPVGDAGVCAGRRGSARRGGRDIGPTRRGGSSRVCVTSGVWPDLSGARRRGPGVRHARAGLRRTPRLGHLPDGQPGVRPAAGRSAL